jgi:hypothetical protein
MPLTLITILHALGIFYRGTATIYVHHFYAICQLTISRGQIYANDCIWGAK